MEAQLETLIKQIKDHGVAEAEKKAAEIQSKAEVHAKQIVDNANIEAARIIENAKKEQVNSIVRGKDAIKQAERDLLLTLETKLKDMCKKYLDQTTQKALDATYLVDIIKSALSSWKFGSNDHIFLYISKADSMKISKATISGSVQSQGPQIDIVVDDSISKGFRISKKGEGAFAFDFTSDAISQALSVFLTPSIQELLK